MAQGAEFPLRKPPGFHWDSFLLGITTFIAGLIGVPAPNGLIPQAPIHTTSLLVMGHNPKHEKDEEDRVPFELSSPRSSRAPSRNSNKRSIPPQDLNVVSSCHEVPTAVVEQRVSNLAQGSLCLVLLTGPFLHLLNLIPRGVLAGLLYVPLAGIHTLQIACTNELERSWYMGLDALQSNGITKKILYLIQDRQLTPLNEPLKRVRKSRILMFIAVELIGFGATFAITQTIGPCLHLLRPLIASC